MVSRLELEHCFDELHKKLADEHKRTNGRLTGDAKIAADTMFDYVQMGLFIGRSFVEDIKRIADALERFDDVAKSVPEFQRQVKETLGIRD